MINKNGAGNANDATYFNPAIVFTVPTVGGIGALTASQLRATSALITWQTAEPGTTEVEYGTTAGYGQTAWMDPRLTMTHSVHLSGLTPNTLYHYRVKSVGATTVQSTDQTFTTPAVPGGSTLYVGSTGFSATQGTNQWTYRDSSAVMPTLLTTGQVVADFGTTWQGGEPFVLLWATGGHPGGARDAIRRWTAPGDGTVQVSGVAHIYGPASTDGVRIQVKQGTTVLHERMFGTNDWSTDGWLLSAVPVTAGSTLDFVINRGGATNSSDATFFDPTIVFTPAAPPSGLSNVTASVLRVTSARITWNTDVPGTTEVEYGLTPAYGLTAPVDPTLVTNHSMYLGGLTPNTVYHYRVKSSNGATTVMSNNATFTTAVPAGGALYAASADFSTSQGVQQWSYRDGAGLLLVGATSGPIFDAVGPYWVGSDPAVLLWNDGGHPGSATNAIRRWTAPASGSVQISGVVYLDDINSVDGVRTQVWHNGLLLTERIIAAGDRSTSELTATVEVVQGDTIDFVINKNGAGNANDATYFNPAIVFTVPMVGGIGGVTASQLRATSALITWQTAAPGTTEVEYGIGGYGETAWVDPRLTTSHSVHLSGLTPNQLYHYRVKSVGATTVQSPDATFTTTAVPGGSTLYVGSTGFSTTQGINQWTYRDSSGPMPTLLTTGQVVIDFGNTWQGGEPSALLWSTGGHPGGTRDAIRRWTAPADGTVQLSGVAHIFAPASTDGVRIQVKQGTTVLFEQLFGPNDWSTAGWFLAAVPVTAGSTLDFVINRGGATNSFDATFFDPTIVFTPAAPPGSGISNVTAGELRVTSARITWNTDVPGTTEVEYGLTTSYGFTAWRDPVLRTTHSMYLGGLQPATVYHYRVKSTNGTGTTSISPDATFTTATVPPGSVLYAASVGFSTTQGTNQWTYRDSLGLMPTVLFSGLIFDFHGPNWQGSEPFVALWNDGGHPGNLVDAVRRWTAPQSGIVDISGMAHAIHPDESDGVLLTIRKNGVVLDSRLFAFNDWTTDVPAGICLRAGGRHDRLRAQQVRRKQQQ